MSDNIIVIIQCIVKMLVMALINGLFGLIVLYAITKLIGNRAWLSMVINGIMKL